VREESFILYGGKKEMVGIMSNSRPTAAERQQVVDHILTTETRLSCMEASRNALQEEIVGLHLYINKLRRQLGLPSIFEKKQKTPDP